MTERRPTVKRIGKRKLALRNELWPDLDESQLWIRTRSKGFTTIPRSMTCILQIMDKLSPGKPLGSTYFALWCHLFDECFVVIHNPRLMAFEAGFGGQRSESTWKVRMKKLLELGFIDAVNQGQTPIKCFEEPHEEVGDCLRKTAGFVNMPAALVWLYRWEGHTFDVSSSGR